MSYIICNSDDNPPSKVSMGAIESEGQASEARGSEQPESARQGRTQGPRDG